jgi:sugar phosphate isomerase/epimerase
MSALTQPTRSGLRWGHALGWPPRFLTGDPDPLLARLEFLAAHHLETTHVSLTEAARWDENRCRAVQARLERNNLSLLPGPALDLWAESPSARGGAVDAALRSLERLKDTLQARLVHVGAGPVHRFLREPSLARQLERLAETLTPLVRGCADLGLRVAIENHGDYYVSDLVELCRRVPGLGIFLDTGNCYLVGEKPLAAAREALPYVLGGHIKDQRVRPVPDGRPLHFEVLNAVPGEGDVPLREILDLLAEAAAARSTSFEMLIEFFPAAWHEPLPEWERARAFIRPWEAPAAASVLSS